MLDKKIFNSVEELFNYRLLKTRPNKHNGKQSLEKEFCDNFEKQIIRILKECGYKPISIAREFQLLYGRCDFVVALEEKQYLIIECKVKNLSVAKNTEDLRFCYAVGQLQTYRTILNLQYKIPFENIKLMLATNSDSLLVHTVIGAENLDIDYLVFTDDGVKYYGKEK